MKNVYENPEYVKIGDKKYKINTDFRVAIECNNIAMNDKIGEYESALAVIYKLFGDEGLNDYQNQEKLLELGVKYLLKGEEKEINEKKDPNMDYIQDKGYIKASFLSDYKIKNIFYIKYMHWYDFCDYLNGLTEDCVLNRVRYIRDYDISEIKDTKERQKWIEQKEEVSLNKKENKITIQQKKKKNKFFEIAGIKERK